MVKRLKEASFTIFDKKDNNQITNSLESRSLDKTEKEVGLSRKETKSIKKKHQLELWNQHTIAKNEKKMRRDARLSIQTVFCHNPKI